VGYLQPYILTYTINTVHPQYPKMSYFVTVVSQKMFKALYMIMTPLPNSFCAHLPSGQSPHWLRYSLLLGATRCIQHDAYAHEGQWATRTDGLPVLHQECTTVWSGTITVSDKSSLLPLMSYQQHTHKFQLCVDSVQLTALARGWTKQRVICPQCWPVVVYQRFTRKCCLHLQGWRMLYLMS
jgi:hypothetical protein